MYRCHGRRSRAGGGECADIFPRLFLSPEEEDEDGVMSEVPFVQQHESLSSSFRYSFFFFFLSITEFGVIYSFFLLRKKKKKIPLPLCVIYSGNLFEDPPNVVGEG